MTPIGEIVYITMVLLTPFGVIDYIKRIKEKNYKQHLAKVFDFGDAANVLIT